VPLTLPEHFRRVAATLAGPWWPARWGSFAAGRIRDAAGLADHRSVQRGHPGRQRRLGKADRLPRAQRDRPRATEQTDRPILFLGANVGPDIRSNSRGAARHPLRRHYVGFAARPQLGVEVTGLFLVVHVIESRRVIATASECRQTARCRASHPVG